MTEVIDRTVLLTLSDTVGEEFVAELIDTFLEEASGMFEEMQQALSRSDADALRRAAHSLKTNASTFGATPLAGLAREIETRARANDLQVEGGLQELEQSYRSAAAELNNYKQALIRKGSAT